MLHWMLSALIVSLSVNAFAYDETIVEEKIYYNYQQLILEDAKQAKGFAAITAFEQGLYVDALWDLVEEGSPEALDTLSDDLPIHFDVTQNFRLGILKMRYQSTQTIPADLIREVENTLLQPNPDIKLIYLIAAYEEDLLSKGFANIVTLAKLHEAYNDIADSSEKKTEITTEVVADLFHKSPDIAAYMNGEYVKSVKLFMFCRNNRLYPCLMVMKDVHGEAVRNEDGTLWTQESLASSARGLPSYVRNGNTAEGIYTMDSVMPHADQTISFGKFRRVILNFVPKSANEKHIKSLIPESSHKASWWQPSAVARDAGRNLFRIHGTGKINKDPATPYFPFMRTSGCVAQKENTYDGVTYKDQRHLLDTMMKALELTPIYSNEVQIKGVLYVMELDDAQAPVTIDDLYQRGIE